MPTRPVKIAIIDSGIDQNNLFSQMDYEGIHFYMDENSNVLHDRDIKDSVGHGTAVTFQIYEKLKKINVSFYIIKIFESLEEVDEKLLVSALKYIEEKNIADIIHISAGVTRTEYKSQMREICQKLKDKGKLIISAFDNNGAISYPAAFDEVIGVDLDIRCQNGNEYIFIKNSIVNILTFGTSQRLPWLNDETKVVSGSSFAAPYITALIGTLYAKGINNYDMVIEYLENNSIQQIQIAKQADLKPFASNNILLFPWNKEQENIVRFASQCKCKIKHVCDVKLMGNIGRSLGSIADTSECQSMHIENIDSIQWSDTFDTVVMGHTGILNIITKTNWKEIIIQKCIDYHKNLYSYDKLSDSEMGRLKQHGLSVYSPQITAIDGTIPTLNKLYLSAIPVVAVLGTSSKQGKFSTQMLIKKQLKDLGYRVGFLSSEPNGLLLGAQHVIPFGFGYSGTVNQRNIIYNVNMMINDIEDNYKPDIILVGSQSQSIPYSTGNLGFYPLDQHALLLGAEPDAVVLCVNPDDEYDYIERTISYINSLIYSKTIAISLFPFRNLTPHATLSTKLRVLEKHDIQNIKAKLSEHFGLPVFDIFNNKKDIKLLTNQIINFF